MAHDTETPVGWRAIKAIGDAAKALVKFDYEYLRDMARKLLYALSNETAGKKRGKGSVFPVTVMKFGARDMKSFIAFILVLLTIGCVRLHQPPPLPEDTRTFEEAKAYFAQEHFQLAHDAYRAVASMPHTALAEQASFNAAFVLVYPKNPDRNYIAAKEEFSNFAQKYPLRPLADEARTWIAVLENFDQSKAHALLADIESLSKKLETLSMAQQDMRANEEKITQERDLIFIENKELGKKADDLLKEKERLLGEKAVIISERDGLEQDKIALQKKVAALTEEKDALIKAKKKLEKSLHDLTMVDVKMEKKRKKIK